MNLQINLKTNEVSFKGEKLKQTEQGGYLFVNFGGKTWAVHRLIWAIANGLDEHDLAHLGNYDVHHMDGNKKNNSPENLQLMAAADHMSLHKSGKAQIRTYKNSLRKQNLPQYISEIKNGKYEYYRFSVKHKLVGHIQKYFKTLQECLEYATSKIKNADLLGLKITEDQKNELLKSYEYFMATK